jgi:DNA processing protein
MDELTRLQLALAVTRPGAGRGLTGRVQERGPSALTELLDDLRSGDRDSLMLQAEELRGRGIGALVRGVGQYPALLGRMKDAPPVLFVSGSLELLDRPAVGICGARNVSAEGLRAAGVCGELAARQAIISVSGYARGVDTATHVASLRAGGGTIIVLPEGINHFRVKKNLVEEVWDPNRSLVVSQFAPNQTWSAGAAMTRNSVIIGLSMALVVVEAGDKGGTLAAGMKALSVRRRVLALEFSLMPPGNKLLLDKGAVAVRSRGELAEFMSDLLHVADESDSGVNSGSVQYSLSVSAVRSDSGTRLVIE